MSRYYMTSENSRGNAVTAAGRSSGQRAHLRGWDLGIEVIAEPNDDNEDEFYVYATRGSNGGQSRKLIARLTLDDNGEYNIRLGARNTEYAI